MAGITGTSNSPREMLERLTIGQRVALVAAFVATVGGLLIMSRLGGNGPMALLFSDLDAGAAASVMSELDAQGIPYEMTDGGRGILVPADQALDLRVQLAADGSVAPADGWSVLDNQGLTASDFDQRVGYQRALEGELARTIASINGVNTAQVHLVMPEKDLFTGDNVMPTASVLLETGGVAVSSAQVRSIVNLVANSVEGLTADQVSVTDEMGRTLASPEGGVSAGGDAAMEVQAAYEGQLNSQLNQLLTAVAGPGNAVASVTAQLDFDSSQTTTESYEKLDPGIDPTPLNETTKRERYRGDGTAVDVGVLGPEDDITDNATDNAGAGVAYDLDEGDVNYAIGRTVTTTDRAPGTVRALSVSVLVNADAVDIDQAELERIVGSAVGFNADRGDTMAVSLIPFDENYQSPDALAFEDPAAADQGGLSSLLPLIRMGVVGLIALVATVLTALFAFRGRKGPQVVSVSPAELESEDPDLEAIGAAAMAALGTGEGRQTTTDLVELIESQPDDVAGMLRAWMAEDAEVRQ